MSSTEADECICCCDELTIENRCSYIHINSPAELPSPYCWGCLQHLLTTRFQDYVDKIYSETCKRTLRTMIERGPPLYLSDPGLPVPDRSYITTLVVPGEDGCAKFIDAIYTGAPRGPDRDALWADLRAAVEQRMELLPDPNDSEEAENL